MKYKVNQPIWYITINKYKEPKSWYSCREDGLNVKELKILGISKYKIVLNNEWFTTVDNDDRENYRKERRYNSYLDDISVNIRVNSYPLEEGVFLSLYSTKKPTKKLLDKMVARASVEIDNKYGFLMKGVVNELWEIVENYETV